jgi:hypothetical protein
MRLNHGRIALMLSAAALTLPMMGCAGYRVVSEPYPRRSPGEQRAYWSWRHR